VNGGQVPGDDREGELYLLVQPHDQAQALYPTDAAVLGLSCRTLPTGRVEADRADTPGRDT